MLLKNINNYFYIYKIYNFYTNGNECKNGSLFSIKLSSFDIPFSFIIDILNGSIVPILSNPSLANNFLILCIE